jgi:hypothetical protein
MMFPEASTMSVIEDSRKAMQDFLAPELRAISARLDALEQRFGLVDKRFDVVEKRFDVTDRNIDSVDRRAEKRHDEVMSAIARIADVSSLQERVARLESKDHPHQ